MQHAWMRVGVVCAIACWAVGAQAAEKPKVRAITAFVRIDREHYRAQVADALKMLRAAKADFEHAGYEVQSIRITTQPFPEYVKGLPPDEALAFLKQYDALAAQEGFDTAIGPAMLDDGDDPAMAQLLAAALSATRVIEGSVTVAGGDGVHWRAVRAAADLMKYVEEHSPHSQGNFNFTAAALVPQDTPFYPGSFHLGPGHQFAIGLQSANVVAEVFATHHDPGTAAAALASALGRDARALEAVAKQVEQASGWTYMGIDLSTAPLKDVSMGRAFENFLGAKIGTSGTITAAATITAALKLIPVRHAGYSGLMLPILEDSVLAERWSQGALDLDSLLAYSAVCGTGLDVVPLPGDISGDRLARIIGDMASLAVKWHKPLSARLLPVAGKGPGQRTEFDDPFLVNAVIQPVK